MENKVETQYTNWVYPEPIEDMRTAISTGRYLEIGDPLMYWPLMWPHKRNAEKLDILVAGCGTNQAAYYACRNPNWNVVGIDLSESSLAHQKKLRTIHGLTNLRLERLDLTEVKTLGLDFDFITSTGVLHHLPDPDRGLSALRDVLRPEGVINLMVYGSSLRLGVYMLQEAFRILGLEQTQKDVELVKTTVGSLHQDHVVKRYTKIASDLGYDGAYVDTFLHPQDRSYWVKEVFEFTRKANLEFLSWCDPIEYSLEGSIPAAHPLWAKINSSNLGIEEKYHIHDLLVQDRGTHRWLCGHPEYVRKTKIGFEGEQFLDYFLIFHRSAKVLSPSDSAKQTNALLSRSNWTVNYEFEVSHDLGKIVEEFGKGSKSIGEAIDKLAIAPTDRDRKIKLLNNEIKSLYERGHVYVLLPERD